MDREREPIQFGEEIKPPTFAGKLRDYGLNLLRDFRGISLRLSAYILGFTTVAVTLRYVGVSEQGVMGISFGFMAVTMAGGEFYFMDRLAKRLPWLSIHHTTPKKEKK